MRQLLSSPRLICPYFSCSEKLKRHNVEFKYPIEVFFIIILNNNKRTVDWITHTGYDILEEVGSPWRERGVEYEGLVTKPKACISSWNGKNQIHFPIRKGNSTQVEQHFPLWPVQTPLPPFGIMQFERRTYRSATKCPWRDLQGRKRPQVIQSGKEPSLNVTATRCLKKWNLT